MWSSRSCIYFLVLGVAGVLPRIALSQLAVHSTQPSRVGNNNRVLRPGKSLLQPDMVLRGGGGGDAEREAAVAERLTDARTTSTTVNPARPPPAPPSHVARGGGGGGGGGGGDDDDNYLGYGLALDPVQNDLLTMGVKSDGESSYNLHEVPSIDGNPVLVEVSVSLRNILEIDEHKQLVTLETTLRLYWRDPRLQVEHLLNNKTADYVLFHPETSNFIWFPDIYIDFAKALRIPTVIIRPASLRIYRNSTCRYATQINYDVACPMNFRKYPYDTQKCKIKYESYGHTVEKMRVVWKKGFDQSKVTENNYISLAQFEYAVFFEENYEEEIASGVYPGVIMTVLLRRKISYHLLQTYLPSGLFVIVAWLSLFLPPESIPGRVTMAMTTLLTLAAMFGAVRQSTPKVSYVSALDIWMCTCIIFVFFALLEYVIVLCLINNCQAGGGALEQRRQTSATLQRRTAAARRPPPANGSHRQPQRALCCQQQQQQQQQSGRHPQPQQQQQQHATEIIVQHTCEAATNKELDTPSLNPFCSENATSPCGGSLLADATAAATGSPSPHSSLPSVCTPDQAVHVTAPTEMGQPPRICIREAPRNGRHAASGRSSSSLLCCSRRRNRRRDSIRSYGNGKQEYRLNSLRASSSGAAALGSLTSISGSLMSGGGMDSLGAATSSSQGELKRPFQKVEKTCSWIMAVLFILFNAIYWPWLFQDEEFVDRPGE